MLEDIFEDPDAKVVVFSQWRGTHELIVRRISTRGWGHVLFHGGIPSEKRGDLIERFRHDPQCRAFLSTDAGGVGLNLQHAATVVNMDQPWNPAVLEQRIARVHRMGQQRSVQVVNFIAQGTIEEGMLSLLSFKKSLFAGVLDGGSSEISMNGTRLARFIEGVEKATGAMGSVEIQEPLSPSPTESTVRDAPPQEEAAAKTEPHSAVRDQPRESPGPEHDALRGLIDTGIKFLTQLAAASQQSGTDQAPTHQNPFLETDARSGRSYLRLPLPEPQTLATIAQMLTAFLPSSKGK